MTTKLIVGTTAVVRCLKKTFTIAFIGVLCMAGHVLAQGIQEPEMVFVAGGTFTMGCTFEQGVECGFDEKPTHEVQLTGFNISKYEVTQSLWRQVMGNNPSRFKGDNLPVENVSWDDIQIFLQRLNSQTGKSYRLPTEAEWEYAARGGNQGQQSQFSGGFEVTTVAWCITNSKNTTHAVGGKQPNELGLYDMSGNVWEWCSDYYGTYVNSRQVNPKGAKKGTARVLRGGCYTGIIQQCRVAARKSLYSGSKDYMTGFRLALDDDNAIRAEAAAQQAEQERIAAEKKAEQDRVAAEKAAAGAAKQAEQERIAAEKKAEQDRVAAEKAAAGAAKQAEQERIAAEKKAEQDRVAAEKKAEQDRVAAERQARKEAHDRKVKHRRDSLRNLPWNTFFTLNVASSLMPQLSYGFKIGQVKVAGWYFSAMTNFQFKGAFSPIGVGTHRLTGSQKSSKISGLLGLAVRPCKAMSLHFGAGFGYRAMTLETTEGWRNLQSRTYYGVDVAFGFMFHGKGFALSIEAVYTPFDFNASDITDLNRLEAKLGIGFMLPHKKNKK